MYKAARYLEEAVKGLVGPGLLFEELGFQYIGPVDGHNLNHLILNLNNIKRLKGPILVHVVTTKGRGYEPAEKDPARFHGISSFDVDSGEAVQSGRSTFTDVFGEALIQLGEQDEKIIAVTAAMGLGTGLEGFSKRFPSRFYDIGIAEAHGVTFSAALAMGGFKPIVAMYSTFLQRGFDQIIEDVCLQDLPVVFAIDRSGIVGQDGPTHNGSFDMSYLRHIPNMVVMAPKDENELKQMLYSAVKYEKAVSIRYPRGEAIGVPVGERFVEIPLGKWEVLREGASVTLVGCGPVVYACLLAAEELEQELGISCAVLNGRFVKPMDREMLIDFASRTKKMMTFEENTVIGGFGSGVMEVLGDERIPVPVKRIGLPDRFLPHSSPKLVREEIGLRQERNQEGRETLAKLRVDVLLARRGLAESREKAKILVMAGAVYLNGDRIIGADRIVDEGAPLEVRENPLPYVGFGGVKLEHAIAHFAIRCARKDGRRHRFIHRRIRGLPAQSRGVQSLRCRRGNPSTSRKTQERRKGRGSRKRQCPLSAPGRFR